MEDKILELLQHCSLTAESLEERLKISKQELGILLKELTTKKLIFMNSHNKYELITKEHIIGKIESNSMGEKFIRHKRNKIYITTEKLHTALKNDLVVIEMYDNNFGNVVGIIERKNKRLVCEVQRKKDELILMPFNIGCAVSLLLNDKCILKKFVEGDRVIVTLENKIDDENNILVKEVTKIGHKNDPKSDEIAIAISKDFEIDFSDEAIKEALNTPDEVRESDRIGRTDFTNENIFTIDSIHTKDMDDAVNIKKLYNGNYLLGVHIADVDHYVKPGMAMYNEAKKRGTSVYLGDTVIPMIPHKLSNGICSLNENVDRLTISVIMEVNEKGKVVNYKIMESVINSKKKMTYEDLNKLFNNEDIDESYETFIEDLQSMRELSDILSKSKNKRGYLNFETNEIKVDSNEQERPIEFKVREDGEAEKIIANFMILANEVIATHFYWLDVPFVYRVHNIPNEDKLETTVELIESLGHRLFQIKNSYGQKAIQNILNSYKGTPEYSIISSLLLRNMAKAQYSTKNIGHFALATDYYCHFTSPIRRFPDLTIHRLLKIFNKDYSMNNLENLQNELDEIAIHSSYKERQADDAEKDYLKLKMAKYMENYIGQEFEGTIVDIDHDNVFIKLENHIKGIVAYTEEFSDTFYVDSYNKELRCVYSKAKYKLGTHLIIKVNSVNLALKEVYFDIVSLQKDKKLVRQLENKK